MEAVVEAGLSLVAKWNMVERRGVAPKMCGCNMSPTLFDEVVGEHLDGERFTAVWDLFPMLNFADYTLYHAAYHVGVRDFLSVFA